jgi:hypothetical protein
VGSDRPVYATYAGRRGSVDGLLRKLTVLSSQRNASRPRPPCVMYTLRYSEPGNQHVTVGSWAPCGPTPCNAYQVQAILESAIPLDRHLPLPLRFTALQLERHLGTDHNPSPVALSPARPAAAAALSPWWTWRCDKCGSVTQSVLDIRCSECAMAPPVNFTGEGVGGAAAAHVARECHAAFREHQTKADRVRSRASGDAVDADRVMEVHRLAIKGDDWEHILAVMDERSWLFATRSSKLYTLLMQAAWHGNPKVVGAMLARHGVGSALEPMRNALGEDAADVAVRRASEDPSLDRYRVAAALCAAFVPPAVAVARSLPSKQHGKPPFCFLKPTRLRHGEGNWCDAAALARLSSWVGRAVEDLDTNSLVKWADAMNPYSANVADAARGVGDRSPKPGVMRWSPFPLQARAKGIKTGLHVSIAEVPESTDGAEFVVQPRRLLCYCTSDAADVVNGKVEVGPGKPCAIAWVVLEVDCVEMDAGDRGGAAGLASAAAAGAVAAEVRKAGSKEHHGLGIAPRDGCTFHMSIGKLVFECMGDR